MPCRRFDFLQRSTETERSPTNQRRRKLFSHIARLPKARQKVRSPNVPPIIRTAVALGRTFMACRSYLLRIAKSQLTADLRSKLNPSDVVQETFLEAQRDFVQFHGDRADELAAWLCHILVNNLVNTSRAYHNTQMRALSREIPLCDGESGGEQSFNVPQDTPSPSEQAIAREETALLDAAVARLPEHYRRIVEMRRQKQTFAQIGTAENCSAEAARKLLARALKRLRQALAPQRWSGA